MQHAKRAALGCSLLALSVAGCTPENASKSGAQAMRPAAVDAGATDAAAAPTGLATIHYLGRFDRRDPAGPRFAWPGTAVAATFRGTGIQATLTDTGDDVLVAAIDGAAPVAVPARGAGQAYTLAANLPAGLHTLVLTKRTEASVGVEQLLGLTPIDGALVPSPDPFTRRIEFVGDSIMCGYGVLGTDCHFSPETEDETIAYPALAAAALHAQQTVIAYSCKGMARDCSGATGDQMPVLFERTLPDDPTSAWDFAGAAPDVVVVDLSSNDFTKGDPGEAFVRAYTGFLQQLRRHYPKAYVVAALSSMVTGPDRTTSADEVLRAVQAARAAGDARISRLDVASPAGTSLGFEEQLADDGYGCDGHPSIRTHRLMGAQLAAAIPLVAGW